jgi:hypothetical protein
MRGVIATDSYTGVDSALTNMRNSTLNRVALMLGDTLNTNVGAAVGLLAGRIGRNPVQRKISRVKDGATTATAAYIGAATVEASSPENVHNKGFITLRTWIGRNGYFFTSDPTCAPDTDDYSTLTHGLVIDKAHRIAYATYLNEVDDEVLIEKDGTINAAYARHMEQIIEDQINGSMTANGEISGVKCTIDVTQNVTSSNKVKAVLAVQPIGYASFIDVDLGFAAKLA